MLRKLFIGLLILSALTSEGTVDLKAALQNLCLFSDTELSLLNDIVSNNKDVYAQKSENQESREIVPGGGLGQRIEYFSFTLNLSSVSFSSTKFDILPGNTHNADRDYSPVIYVSSTNEPILGSNKDIILDHSDSSPPTFFA